MKPVLYRYRDSESVIYQPKGSMCASCQHRREDCSRLPFERMRVVESINHGAVQIVRCSEYIKDRGANAIRKGE